MITFLRQFGPPVILLMLLAGAFGPAVAEGRLLAPGDGLAQYFPQRVAAASAWLAGEVPFWNPYVFGGMPLMAAFQAGVFFPANWLFCVLPSTLAMNAAVVLAYAVAGLAMLAFARAIALPTLAALLSASVFMGGGFMVGHLEHLALIQAAGLLPAVLWGVERFRATLNGRYAIASGLFLALMVLAGHPQTAVLGAAVAGAYGLFRLAGLGRETASYLLQLGLALALGLGLAAAQILPGLDLASASARQHLGYAALVETSLAPRELLTLLFPFFFGTPGAGGYFPPYWGTAVWPNEISGYVGLGALLLGGVAVLGTFFREGQTRFWSAVALLAGLLALGGATPLYQLWAQLPVLSAIRVPARHLLELDLALALLAGLGLRALLEPGAGKRLALVSWGALGAVMLAVGAFVAGRGSAIAARLQPLMPENLDLAAALSVWQPAFWLPLALWLLLGGALALWGQGFSRFGLGAFVAVTLADLFVFGQFQGWRQLSPAATIVEAAPQAEPGARTVSISANPYPYHDAPLVAALRAPLAGALWGVKSVNGYEPLLTSRYAKLVGSMTHGGVMADERVWGPKHRAIDLLSGRWVRLDASLAATPEWRTRMNSDRWRLVAKAERVWVYENLHALPRAWRPAEALVLSSAEVDRRVMGGARFEPSRQVLLESGAGLASAGPVVAETLSANHLRVTTAAATPGLVVLSEGYDPGWRAYTGRTELPVQRANGLLLAVQAPAGASEIDLWYEPRRWRWGLAISTISALLLLFWWASCARRREKADA